MGWKGRRDWAVRTYRATRARCENTSAAPANGSVPPCSAAGSVAVIMMASVSRRCGMKKVTAKKAGDAKLTAGSRRLWIEWCW